MTAPWSLGDEYRAERILELEAIRDELLTLPHADACVSQTADVPGGCDCPLFDVLDLLDGRMLDLQPDRYDQ